MPQIKSQEKRVRTTKTRTDVARGQKTALKTAIKRVLTAVESGNKDEAVVALNNVNKKLDASITGGLHHPNYVNRQKSRLSKAVNNLK